MRRGFMGQGDEGVAGPNVTLLPPPPDIEFESSEPWAQDTVMIIPNEGTQIIMPESAAVLGVHAFLKITKLPYTAKEAYNSAAISPSGKLPVVKCGAFVVSEMEGVVNLAASKGVNLSGHLSAAERADLRAYMSLVHNVLGNAMLYFSWLDDTVYTTVTKSRVASPYNFPLRNVLPWSMRRKIKDQLVALKWGTKTPEQVYQEVETCLVTLSERLGKSEYFFGSSPTELDALVFGYLFTMITTPLPNNIRLGDAVKREKNLVKFCQRLEKDYFSTIQQEE